MVGKLYDIVHCDMPQSQVPYMEIMYMIGCCSQQNCSNCLLTTTTNHYPRALLHTVRTLLHRINTVAESSLDHESPADSPRDPSSWLDREVSKECHLGALWNYKWNILATSFQEATVQTTEDSYFLSRMRKQFTIFFVDILMLPSAL